MTLHLSEFILDCLNDGLHYINMAEWQQFCTEMCPVCSPWMEVIHITKVI